MDLATFRGGGGDLDRGKAEDAVSTGARSFVQKKYPIDYTYSVAFSTRNEVIIASWFKNNKDMKKLLEKEISSLDPVSGWICYAEPDWRCFTDCPVVPLVRFGFGKPKTEALRAWCGGEVSDEYMLRYVVPAERHVPLVPNTHPRKCNLYFFENPQIEKYNEAVKCYYKSNLPLLPGEQMYHGVRLYEPNWGLLTNFKILQNGSGRYKQIISMEIMARLWSNIYVRDPIPYINIANKQIIAKAATTSESMQEVLIKLWDQGYCADLRSLVTFDSESDKYYAVRALEEKHDDMVLLPIWQVFLVPIESTLSFFTALYLYLKAKFPKAFSTDIQHLNEFTAKTELSTVGTSNFKVSQSFLIRLYKPPSVKRFVKNILDKFTLRGLIMPNISVEQDGLRTALWLLFAAPYILVPLRNAVYQSIPNTTAPILQQIWEWFEESYDDKESDTVSDRELNNLASNFPKFCNSVEASLKTNRDKSFDKEFALILNLIWPWKMLIQPFPFSKNGPFYNFDECRCKMRKNDSPGQGFYTYAKVFKVSEKSYYILDAKHNLLFGVRGSPKSVELHVFVKA